MNIIRQGDVEPIVAWVCNSEGVSLTGKTDIQTKVWRISDRKYLDWQDMTFKSGGSVSVLLKSLIEVNSSLSPGEYATNFDTGQITNPLTDDTYQVVVVGGADAANLPVGDELKVGQWLDDLLQTEYVVMQSYSYNPVTSLLTGFVWVESRNFVVLDPTFASVTWYDEDGVSLFTMTDAAADSQGIFHVWKDAPGLLSNKAYYAVSTITRGSATMTSCKGSFTLG
jgi:hypothetical protein